jgi:hypothetical protein
MFGFIVDLPNRLKHLFSKFKKHFTKPQYENFCRAEIGIMVAGEGEHDVKSINELFIDKKKPKQPKPLHNPAKMEHSNNR